MPTAIRSIEGPALAGPYVPGLLAEGRFVYVSGQLPMRDGQLVAGTIEEETALALDNVRQVLERAGASLQDVVKCGVFVADLGDLDGFNAAYGDVFDEHRPTRTTVGAQLPHGRVEIDCVAVLPSSPGRDDGR